MHVLNAMTGIELAEEGLRQIAVAIKNNAIKIEPGRVYPDVYAHGDTPGGVSRVTYVMFSPTIRNEVIARCTIIFDLVREGVATWQITGVVSFAMLAAKVWHSGAIDKTWIGISAASGIAVVWLLSLWR